MDLNKTTQKVQEALQQAQVKGLRFGHQEVDAEHVLFALLEQDNGLVPRLIENIGASVPVITTRLEQELEKKPRFSRATESGKVLFKPLTEDEISGIVKLLVQDLKERLDRQRINLEISEEALRHIAHEWFDPI